MLRAEEIVNKLLNHEITKREAIEAIVARNNIPVGVCFEITSTGFTVENNHSVVKLVKKFGHEEIKDFLKAGDNVRLIRID